MNRISKLGNAAGEGLPSTLLCHPLAFFGGSRRTRQAKDVDEIWGEGGKEKTGREGEMK